MRLVAEVIFAAGGAFDGDERGAPDNGPGDLLVREETGGLAERWLEFDFGGIGEGVDRSVIRLQLGLKFGYRRRDDDKADDFDDEAMVNLYKQWREVDVNGVMELQRAKRRMRKVEQKREQRGAKGTF